MKITLIIDSIINYFLGIVLLFYSPRIINFFDLPRSSTNFYPNILGSIFIGIAIALTLEAFNKNKKITGLGLFGASSINICGGLTLFFWLIFGDLNLRLKGSLILWILAISLFLISSIEFLMVLKGKKV